MIEGIQFTIINKKCADQVSNLQLLYLMQMICFQPKFLMDSTWHLSQVSTYTYSPNNNTVYDLSQIHN